MSIWFYSFCPFIDRAKIVTYSEKVQKAYRNLYLTSKARNFDET